MLEPARRLLACEKRNNRAIAVLIVFAVCLVGRSFFPESVLLAAAADEGEAAHGESLIAFISRLANFVILVGGLGYLLRNPVKQYLDTRFTQIRGALDAAEETTERSERDLARIESQLAALPGELERLKRRGAEEIAAEEARIERAAAEERDRLLEQTRREIDLRLRLAKQELVEQAADLALARARARIETEATPADQVRLIDRYVSRVEEGA